MTENNNNLSSYTIRVLEESDHKQVYDLWSVLDFLGAIYENQVIIKVDPKGIFVAQDCNTGQILGICSGIIWSPQLAFIGQYGVRPEYQGIGIGTALWDKVMEHIGPERNICLFSMDYMFDKYVKRNNFKLLTEKRALRHTGKADCSQLIESIDGISVVPISEDNIDKVIQYDRQICDGLDRTVLIKEISKIKEYVNGVAISDKQEVVGYCVIKLSFLKTGIVEPLYANDERIAELLIGKCCRSMAITQTNGLVYPCWSTRPESVAIARKMGLEVSRSTNIIFTKKLIEGDMNRIFCIFSRTFSPF